MKLKTMIPMIASITIATSTTLNVFSMLVATRGSLVLLRPA
jgi:hypothetical protein